MLKKLPITMFVLFMIPALTILAGAIPVGPNIRITDSGADDSFEPSLAVVGDTVYAVWDDQRDDSPHDTNGAVYFAKSTDGGQTWGANVRVSNPEYDKWADDPQIAVQPDGTIWVIWYQLYRDGSNKVNDLRVAFSEDGGASFNNEFILINGFDNNESMWRPDLAADENGVYTLYRYYNCAAPCNSNSQDGYTIALSVIDVEALDSATTTVSDDLYAGRFTSSGLDDGPAVNLTLRDGVMCAAWEDYRDRLAIYGACSNDSGKTFGTNFAITGADAVNPKITLAPNGTLFATYSLDTDSENNIWITHSADLGQTWTTPIQLTNEDAWEVEYWDLAVDESGQLLLSWVVESGISRSDLYLSTSLDNGVNWSLLRVEDDQGEYPTTSDQRQPDLVQGLFGGNNYAYLAWSDDRNIDDEIWFSRFLLDGDPPAAPQNVAATGVAGAIQITWDPGSNPAEIQGYQLYRSSSANGPFNKINPLQIRSTSYVDPEQLPGVTFYYQVAAVDTTGNFGPRSAVVSAAATAETTGGLFGTITYETDSGLTIQTLGATTQISIPDSRSPRYATNGSVLYYLQDGAVWQSAINGDSAQLFRTTSNPNHTLFDFDIAANNELSTIEYRTFASLAGGGICTVTEPKFYNSQGELEYTELYDLGSYVAISADGGWISYTTNGWCNAATLGVHTPPDFCILNTATEEATCLDGVDFKGADFASSGNWLVFAAEFTGQHEIWKAQVQSDGSLTNYAQLTNSPAGTSSINPSWSTDGNWITFERDIDPSGTENWQVYAVRSDGVAVQPLGFAGTDPVWHGGGEAAPITGLSNRVYLPSVVR